MNRLFAEATLMANLYKVFMECDCTMLEINPLASLSDGRVLVCDSKAGKRLDSCATSCVNAAKALVSCKPWCPRCQ